MIFLDISITTIFGAASTILVGLVGWFTRDAYARVNERLDRNEKNIQDLQQEVTRNKGEGEAKVSELKINILEKLDIIKDKFSEVRK